MFCHRTLTSLLLAVLLVTLASAPAAAQDTATASGRLRVINLFYGSADVSLDGAPYVPALGFTFLTSYDAITGGSHTLTVAGTVDEAEFTGATDFDVADEHDVVIVIGGDPDTDDAPTLFVLDETDLLAGLDPAGHRVIMFHHMLDEMPAVDVAINDEVVVENLSYGEAAAFAAPLEFVQADLSVAGSPNEILYEQENSGLPYMVTFVSLIGRTPDDIWIGLSNASSQTAADHLRAELEQDGDFAAAYQALEAAGLLDMLAGEGPFTLFLPNSETLRDLPGFENLLADPEALAAILRYHIVPENIPPYELYGQTSLPTLAGIDLVLEFPNDDWWNVNGAAIYTDLRVTNGVIYWIDGVLLPE